MDYLEVNRANWDSRAPIHAKAYGIEGLLADPTALSDVVRFDLPRLATSPAWTSFTCSATSAPTPSACTASAGE